jgi:16S rRNA (guanine966-N2)-methyltransferase
MKLRIVAGEFGGRRISTPAGTATRPTRESVREAWFSALGDRLNGARVLDLFSGSGALGLEALSRGATHVDFIERSPVAFSALERNVEALDVADRTDTYREEAFSYLSRVAASVAYDIALADPPYDSDAARRLIELNRRQPFARLLCLEYRSETLPDAGADVAWQRRYGDTTLAFFTSDDSGGYPGGR